MIIMAKEARRLSDSANSNKWIKELEEIEKKIKDSFETGEYNVIVNKKLENKTIVELEEAGYKVEYNESNDSWFKYKLTTISW